MSPEPPAPSCDDTPGRAELTLHFLQFAHVRVKEGVDALGLSVPIDVQLDVCWEAAARTQRDQSRKNDGVNHLLFLKIIR